MIFVYCQTIIIILTDDKSRRSYAKGQEKRTDYAGTAERSDQSES